MVTTFINTTTSVSIKVYILNNIDNELPSLAQQNFSPLFVLFLDCVYQLLTQNPTEFQFTEGYLSYLAYHSFTSKFYELTRQGHLNQLNLSQVSFNGAGNSNSVNIPASELVSIFSTINVKKFVNKMYMSPEQPIDMRRLRPLYY
jgi:hypothetical protein